MFNIIDTILIILLFIIFLHGLFKGAISILTPIAALVTTLIIAPLIYNHASKFFDHSLILKIISFLITYSIIRIIFHKMEKNVKEILSAIFLSWVDKLIGAFMLVLIACIIIYISSLLIIYYIPQYDRIIKESKVVSYIYNFINKNDYTNKLYSI